MEKPHQSPKVLTLVVHPLHRLGRQMLRSHKALGVYYSGHVVQGNGERRPLRDSPSKHCGQAPSKGVWVLEVTPQGCLRCLGRQLTDIDREFEAVRPGQQTSLW